MSTVTEAGLPIQKAAASRAAFGESIGNNASSYIPTGESLLLTAPTGNNSKPNNYGRFFS